jgi:enoyl-CoA hydratase
MLDHVFTDAISALRDAFEAAFLERQAFEEHFQSDVLLGDLTWETSYGLPGEGEPPRVVAHITFDWPAWSQAAYRQWYVEEELERRPAIEMEIVLRVQRLADTPDSDKLFGATPERSPLVGDDLLERAGLTTEIAHPDLALDPTDLTTEYAVEITYEGLYELAEETVADGTSALLDEHFGALGGWIAATLVKLGDLELEFLPAEDAAGWPGLADSNRRVRRLRVSTVPLSGHDVRMSPDPVLLDVSERIATVTLNRPDARNALSSEVLALLNERTRAAEADPDVDVIVLTGADPAFCAGLDLKELGSTGGNLGGGGADGGRNRVRGPFPRITKPVIGAINGVAITGGFELALNCDFLIASERAKFGDTHTRVGVMPGWGLTVLLPQAIGVRRAREMSFTGNFMDADEALRFGLVNRVVPHDSLIPTTRSIARDIIGNDQAGVRKIRSTYDQIATNDDHWETEARDGRAWRRSNFSPEQVAERRRAIQARGQQQ